MTAAEFVRLLKRARKTSGGWMACCPAHDDSAPSLSVGEGADGRVLVRCWAGCPVDAIAAAVGLAVRDLFADDEGRMDGCTLAALAHRTGLSVEQLRSFGAEDGTFPRLPDVPAVAISYRDEQGIPLRPKYRIRLVKAPSGGERFVLGDGTGMAPYGLWRLDTAREKGALVLTEGESDTWALWAEGVPALGIPGASQAKLLQRDHLTGVSQLWLARDADAAGEELANALTARLSAIGYGEPLRVIVPPRPHKDVCEWRKASGAAFLGEFRAASKAAIDGAPKGPIRWAHEVEPRRTRFAFCPYIPKGYLTLLAGKPGTAKTLAACALIAALTDGRPVLGSEPERAGKAILFSAEDDIERVLQPRLRQAGARLDRVGIFDFDVEDFSLNGDGLKRLEMLIETERPELIVLDPIVTFLSADVDINQANEVRAVLRPLAMLAKRTETAVLVIAHVKKGNTGAAIDSVIGSMDFMAAVRSALITYRDPEGPKDRQCYVLSHVKHNLTAPGPGLRYEVRPSDADPLVPDLRWVARSRFSAEQLATSDDDAESVEEAVSFLRTELVRTVRVNDVRKRARVLGISDKTLATARRRLGVSLDQREDSLGRTDYFYLPITPDYEGMPV